MTSETRHKRYRIGDFAKFLGVTPDFLKHYEEFGLLKVEHGVNGYRYYNFDQSSRILDYMRLRNYGVTVREMAPMLSADANEAVHLLDIKVQDLQKQADRIQAVIEEHKRLDAWIQKRTETPVDWEVRNIESHYFLPHSILDDFIKDDRIHAILRDWMSWMPIAKSGLYVKSNPKDCERPYTASWGLILPESVALRYNIPVNDAVLRTAAGKALIYHFVADEKAFSMDLISQGFHPVFKQVSKLGLKPADELFLIVEMKLINPDGTRRGGYGRFAVLLAN